MNCCSGCGHERNLTDGLCAACRDDVKAHEAADRIAALEADNARLRGELDLAKSLIHQISCSHADTAGGNDYLQCRQCGLEWDYRRMGPIEATMEQAVEYFKRNGKDES